MFSMLRFTHLRIGQRLAIGFGLAICLMLAVTLTGDRQIGRIASHIKQMSHDFYPKTVMANTIKAQLNETARSMRNLIFMTTVDEIRGELATIDKAGKAIRVNLAQFDALDSSAEGRNLLKAVGAARARYDPVLTRFLQLVNDGQVEQARDLVLPEIAPLQHAYFDALDKLIAFQGGLMEAAGKEAGSAADTAKLVMNVLTAVAAVVAALTGLLVARSITGPLTLAMQVARRVASGDLGTRVEARGRDETGQLLAALGDMNQSLAATVNQVRTSTETISHAAHEIASGNADLSARTEAQASSLEQTASSMAELTETVRLNAESARQASTLVSSATGIATNGGAVVRQVIDTMGAIKESSHKIVDIISVIDAIAFQTNILALNAAVEAARAGEQGRGFAVVAAEVRNLAQRSAASAQQIKTLIGASVGQVDAGSRLVDAAGRSMNDIVDSVRQVSDIIGQIAAASAEQRSGIEEVNLAIAQIDDMTQRNAALVEQAAASADSMKQLAVALAEAVAVFKLAPDTPAPGARAAPPAPALPAPRLQGL
jgi:methyl-accepting chemotaxis protein